MMRETMRWTVLAAVAVSMWVLVPSPVGAGLWMGAPDTPTGTEAEPPSDPTTPTTVAESSAPTTEPDESVPETSADITSADDALVGAGEPDGDIDTTTAAFAVVGFIALIALASWWMVRRADPDAEPMPREPPSELL